ncbi:hypothetical protein [Streptomyces sp. NPDC005969]|uniref:hypothetical protein n=1 Tax=Streptomyces sp. NPDC005969 TaxID=3156722 RepID=UPI0033F87EDC
MSDQLSAARLELDRAAQAVHREEVLATLKAKSGLAYASLGESDQLGPFLVSFNGQLIGQVRSGSDADVALRNWFACPTGDADPEGPFVTIRAAAASMIR